MQQAFVELILPRNRLQTITHRLRYYVLKMLSYTGWSLDVLKKIFQHQTRADRNGLATATAQSHSDFFKLPY